jgi:hypothetical protein
MVKEKQLQQALQKNNCLLKYILNAELKKLVAWCMKLKSINLMSLKITIKCCLLDSISSIKFEILILLFHIIFA